MIVKVCGMRDPENIRQVVELGINWIGLIFYNESPRFVEVDNHFQLSTFNFQLPKVGVFVNSSTEETIDIAKNYKLDYLQLHGNESPETCHTLQKRGYRLIKAFSIASSKDLEIVSEYEGRVDYFLFDTKCEEYGGSGKSFDWSVLAEYKGKTPFLLSGGINPDSVESIKKFHHSAFAGIDLNSGFEIAPAIKDIKRLESFLKAININR